MRPKASKGNHITATTLNIEENGFDLTADISELLEKHGPGIYSVILIAQPDHMDTPTIIATHPIFWKTTPPPDNPYSNIHLEQSTAPP